MSQSSSQSIKKNSRKAPAYQEYATDMLANRQFRQMTLAERGLFYTMRLECWANEYIPAHPDELADYLGKPRSEVASTLTERVLAFFANDTKGLYCPELKNYRQALDDRRQKQSEGGQKGGRSTQSKVKANLEGNLNVLSRDERSREDQSRTENLSSESAEWINEYDAYEDVI